MYLDSIFICQYRPAVEVLHFYELSAAQRTVDISISCCSYFIFFWESISDLLMYMITSISVCISLHICKCHSDDQQNLSTCSRKRRKSARLNSKSSAQQQQGNGEPRTPPVFRSKNKSAEKSNNSGDFPPHFEKIIKPYNFSCCRMVSSFD